MTKLIRKFRQKHQKQINFWYLVWKVVQDYMAHSENMKVPGYISESIKGYTVMLEGQCPNMLRCPHGDYVCLQKEVGREMQIRQL